MRALLLDTHAFLWWGLGDSRLPERLRSEIDTSHDVRVSAATAWEIHTKYRLGKMPEIAPLLVVELTELLAAAGFTQLPVSFADGERAGSLPGTHKDPFDRMLAAQALNHRLALVSNDTALDVFGIVRVW